MCFLSLSLSCRWEHRISSILRTFEDPRRVVVIPPEEEGERDLKGGGVAVEGHLLTHVVGVGWVEEGEKEMFTSWILLILG